MKKNKLPSHEKIWENLNSILLSEGGQSEKATDCMITTTGHSGKGRTIRTVEHQ